MKEATGEFSMTVVTILAVVVIAGIISILSPAISGFVKDKWCEISGQNVGCLDKQTSEVDDPQ